MITLNLGNTWTHVEGNLPKAIVTKIKDRLSYKPEGYMFMPTVKRGLWDGTYHLYHTSRYENKFPTGMIHEVIKILKKENVQYYVKDVRTPVEPTLNIEWNYHVKTPRYYQNDAVEAALKKTRGIINLPTASGKMLVAAHIIYKVKAKATIFVTNEEALNDTYEEFKSLLSGPTIGRWSSKEKTMGDIMVCTIQSLYKKNRGSAGRLWKHFLECGVIILDEVHAAGADEYFAIAKESDAKYKFGQSGTAFRGDGKDMLLQAATGPIIYKKLVKELQAEGFLAPCRIEFYETEMPSNHTEESLVELDPHAYYRTTIVENDRRNALAKAVFEKYRHLPTLVIVKSEQHLRYISEYFGIPLVFGKSSKGYRKAIQDSVRVGDIMALVATKVYDQSVNLPRLKCLINLAGHSPKNSQIQRLGRVLRLYDDQEAIMCDFYDSFESSALAHSLNRKQYLEDEGHDIVDIPTGTLGVKYDSKLEDIIKYRPIKKEESETRKGKESAEEFDYNGDW